MKRQEFVALSGGLALAAFASSGCVSGDTIALATPHEYGNWIRDYQIAPQGICRYYRFGPHANMLTPLASAYAVLFFIDRDLSLAQTLGDALVALQRSSLDDEHVGGGVPSAVGGSAYYSSDALICLKVMVALARATGRTDYATSARQFYAFIARMSEGASKGYLSQDVGYPMRYVTRGGAYQNELAFGDAMLFFDAIRDYAEFSGYDEARAQYERGKEWLIRSSQATNGAFYAYYDPGPMHNLHNAPEACFLKNGDGRVVGIGDVMMMSALGAQRIGAHEMADKFISWLRPVKGAFYAYMKIDAADSGFEAGVTPYYDIVCSGMYCVLMSQAGHVDDPSVSEALKVLADARAPDDGYRWGLYEGGAWVDGAAEALTTGYWATASLDKQHVPNPAS